MKTSDNLSSWINVKRFSNNQAQNVRELVITSLFEEDPSCVGGGGGRGVEDTTYLMNITDKILLASKFELT